MTTALLLAAMAAMVVPERGQPARSRLSLAGLGSSRSGVELPGAPPPSGPGPRGWQRFTTRPAVPGGLAAGLALALLVGGLPGLAAGAAGGLLAARLLARLEPAADRRLRARREAELPDVLELLATALGAGLPVPAALTAVAAATGGTLAPDLHRVGELSRLGAGPATAWADHADDPVLGPVARAARRSADSGAALAESLATLAAERRAAAALRAEAAARRAGVLAMAPLGLCFLPAFVCLGVAPVVVGIAGAVLH